MYLFTSILACLFIYLFIYAFKHYARLRLKIFEFLNKNGHPISCVDYEMNVSRYCALHLLLIRTGTSVVLAPARACDALKVLGTSTGNQALTNYERVGTVLSTKQRNHLN